jgi:hypothetical protein
VREAICKKDILLQIFSPHSFRPTPEFCVLLMKYTQDGFLLFFLPTFPLDVVDSCSLFQNIHIADNLVTGSDKYVAVFINTDQE